MSEVDVAVIGAGPAGLSAACAAARAGARTAVLDSFPDAGGQYAVQPLAGSRWQDSKPAMLGRRLRDEALAAGVQLLTSAELWGVFPGFELLWSDQQGETGGELRAANLVVASGAHDRPVAFPGWTLPGVMTVGAAQRMLKTTGVLPGRRLLLAGTGPFLPLVSAQLASAGASVTMLEAAPPGLSLAAGLMSNPWRWAETGRIVLDVLRNDVRLRFGEVVSAVEQHCDGLQAWLRPLRDGRVDTDAAPHVAGVFDAVLVSYGFRPRLELTSMLGCSHAHDPALGGWHCVVDEHSGATDVDGVFAAGETTGVAGVAHALPSGRRAGSHAAARALGGSPPRPAELAQVVEQASRARRFGEFLGRVYPLPEGLGALADADTLLCRCESVTRADIEAAIADGADTAQALKMWTRCGMGPCQGRICGAPLGDLLQHALGVAPQSAGFNEGRTPLLPVALADVQKLI